MTPETVLKASGSSAGSVNLDFSAASTVFDYLAVGEVVTLTYTVAIDDHHGGVTPQTFVVTITGTDDTPVVSTTSNAFTELVGTHNATLDTVTGTISFTDVDLTDRPTITTAFTSYTYKDAHGTDVTSSLTPAQLADVAAVEAALSLSSQAGNANNGSATWTYSLTDSNFDFLAKDEVLTLTYTATVNDHNGGVISQPITVTITGTDDASVIADVAPTASYTQLNPAVTLSSGLTVSDVDNTTLASAMVSVGNGYLAGDVLSVNGATSGSSNGISWSQASGVLSFTGSSSLANYQALLDEVQYSTSSSNPTNFGTDTSRTINWVINDGTLNSTAATTTVNITAIDAALIVGNAGNTIVYTELQAIPPAIDAGLTVSDADSLTLASAAVSITNGFLAGDALDFSNQNGISGSYNAATGVLTLSGTATRGALPGGAGSR